MKVTLVSKKLLYFPFSRKFYLKNVRSFFIAVLTSSCRVVICLISSWVVGGGGGLSVLCHAVTVIRLGERTKRNANLFLIVFYALLSFRSIILNVIKFILYILSVSLFPLRPINDLSSWIESVEVCTKWPNRKSVTGKNVKRILFLEYYSNAWEIVITKISWFCLNSIFTLRNKIVS